MLENSSVISGWVAFMRVNSHSVIVYVVSIVYDTLYSVIYDTLSGITSGVGHVTQIMLKLCSVLIAPRIAWILVPGALRRTP